MAKLLSSVILAGLLPFQTQHKMGRNGRHVADWASAVQGEEEHYGRERVNEHLNEHLHNK